MDRSGLLRACGRCLFLADGILLNYSCNYSCNLCINICMKNVDLFSSNPLLSPPPQALYAFQIRQAWDINCAYFTHTYAVSPLHNGKPATNKQTAVYTALLYVRNSTTYSLVTLSACCAVSKSSCFFLFFSCARRACSACVRACLSFLHSVRG